MGTNNLPQAVDGTPIPASDHNALKEALQGAFVPRNSSGIPTDLGGSHGTTLFRWSEGYFNKILIGLVANLISIEDNAGQLEIKILGVTKCVIDSTGIVGSYLKDLSVTAAKIANNVISPTTTIYTSTPGSPITIPSGVTKMFGTLVGGSGGGGGGGGANVTGGSVIGAGGGGGGGGSRGQINSFLIRVSAGDQFTLTIGNGGAGGPAGIGGSPGVTGTAGSAGQPTIMQRTTAAAGIYSRDFYRAAGGAGGLGGTGGANSVPGVGGNSGTNPDLIDELNAIFRTLGGIAGNDGGNSVGGGGGGGGGGLADSYNAGWGGYGDENLSRGDQGTSTNAAGGGGGGGGGASHGLGKGGKGGNGGKAASGPPEIPTAGATVIGSGGGGGGGGGGYTVGGNPGASAGAAGGTGGRGYAIIGYWTKE